MTRRWLELVFVDVLDRSVLDDLQVMASEITTNAVEHSGRPMGDPLTITSTFADGMIHVEIEDQGSGVPVLAPRSLVPPSGLAFVELLSDRWGSRQEDSFHVWFEVAVPTDGVPVETITTAVRPDASTTAR